MFKFITWLLGTAFLITIATVTQAGQQRNAQICVARLDGAPVYHWSAFTSGVLRDDVDRALVLREFRRRNFKLPAALVDEAIQRNIAERYAGDKKRFAESLKHKGVQMADYRRFVVEEITIIAMLYQSTQVPRIAQAEWLATLRKGARIKLLAKATRS